MRTPPPPQTPLKTLQGSHARRSSVLLSLWLWQGAARAIWYVSVATVLSADRIRSINIIIEQNRTEQLRTVAVPSVPMGRILFSFVNCHQ
jgi:hypothetical protein